MGLIPARSALVLAGVLTIAGTFAVGPAPNADATPATNGDFSGLVDIGGRSLYLECRGQGSPTVILEAGANGRGDVWSRDNQQPAGAADHGAARCGRLQPRLFLRPAGDDR